MQIIELINLGSKRLKSKDIDSNKLDSEILLSKVLNKRREELLLNLNQKVRRFLSMLVHVRVLNQLELHQDQIKML